MPVISSPIAVVVSIELVAAVLAGKSKVRATYDPSSSAGTDHTDKKFTLADSLAPTTRWDCFNAGQSLD